MPEDINSMSKDDTTKRTNCPYCGIVFDSSDDLFTHVFTAHSC
ncbi:hypothetical protein [Candidatus Magnetominusculus dajiuhuensis]